MIDLRHGVEWRLVAFYAVAIGASIAFEWWLVSLFWSYLTS